MQGKGFSGGQCKVWESAMCTSVLYGSESWLTNNLKAASSVYNSTLKELLGVRLQTPNDLVHAELGVLPVQLKIKQGQRKFLEKIRLSSHFSERPSEESNRSSKISEKPHGQILDGIGIGYTG